MALPGRSPSAVAAAVAGALVAQLLSLAPGGIPAARAAWCWTAQPPKCDAPAVTDGACAEGAALAAGQTCTPTCTAPKVPSCTTQTAIQCPPELGGAGCTNDLSVQDGWWVPCGLGDRCLSNIPLGTQRYARFGSFSCVDPNDPGVVVSPCLNAPPPAPPAAGADLGSKMDVATLALLGSLVGLLGLGAVLARAPAQGATRALFKPGPGNFSLANIIGVVLVLVGLIAFCAGLAVGRLALEKVFIMGLAAGIAASLPIWWACFRAGAHNAVKMSREAAWRIHIAFGDFALIFGLVHGVQVGVAGVDISSSVFFVLGLVGLILMFLGVFVTVLNHAQLISYDTWKMLHFMSMLGYVLALVHMIDHAVKFNTTRSWAVTGLNILALVVFIGQKVYVKFTAARVSVKEAEVLTEPSGRHVLLRLDAPGFPKPAPGQWGHLAVPSISAVPHPFTLVPGADGNEVRLFVKVSGLFTRRLADAIALGGNAPKMSLEGPYGEPPLPSLKVDAVAFVLGGVGVTPALSLAAEAKRMCGDKVCLYWALRSPDLLRRSAPLLEPSVNLRSTCVRLSGDSAGGAALPLEAREGREDVSQWVANMSSDLQSQGAKSALLFCCGPKPLTSAAASALGRLSDGLTWHLHVEEFLFLPKPPFEAGRKGAKGSGSSAPVQVIGAGASGA